MLNLCYSMRNMAMPQFAGAKLHLFYQTTKFFFNFLL